MSFRVFFILIVATILSPFLFAQQALLPDAPSATQEKLKADLNKYASEQKKVTVKLKDTAKITGTVQEVGKEDFLLSGTKNGQAKRINYDDVTEVKKTGLSKTVKVLIGVGIGVGALVAVCEATCPD